MLLFVVIALLATARRSWPVAGVAASLATLTWQPAFVVVVAVVVAAWFSEPADRRARSVSETVLGGLAPLAIVACYFAVEGAWYWFSDGFFNVGLRASVRYAYPLGEQVQRIVRVATSGYGGSLWIFLVGMLAMPGVIVWRIRSQPNWRRIAADRFSASTLVFLLCIAWTVYEFQGSGDLFILLPLAAIGVAGIAHGLMSMTGGRAAPAMAVTVAIGACVFAAVTAVSSRDELLLHQVASVDALIEQLPPDSELLSLGAPQALALSGRTNRNPYLVMYPAPAAHLEANWPGGMDGFVAELDADPPEVILRRPHLDDDEPAVDEAGGSVLNDWIEANYVPRGGAPGWTWMVHRSIADDVERVRPSLG